MKGVNFTVDPNSVVEHSMRLDDETDEVAIVATGSAGALSAGHTSVSNQLMNPPTVDCGIYGSK